ncbi:hypothetical protein [Botrimarina hoheduenensis]|nr:hypothetical protein [Botrimarina hoheduenensis]
MADLAKQANQQAAAQAEAAARRAEAAAREAQEQKRRAAEKLATESPSAVTIDDMSRGDKIQGSGVLKTPIKAGIRAEQKLNLIQVEQALQLFWGFEGRYPNSHEEFMEKVVEFNELQLEPLEEPYEYWYNAESHELWKRVKPAVAEAAAAEAAEEQPSETNN